MCPKEGCVREFSSNAYLDQHLILGNCNYQSEKQCLTDRAKSLYFKKIHDGFPSSSSLYVEEIESSIVNNDDKVNLMGWAVKTKRKKVVFTDAQIQFIQQKFDIGKRTGKKVDPFCAAAEMRKLKQFEQKDFLSGQQIASRFSRLAQKDRKGDFAAAKDEEKKSLLKKEMMDHLNQ